MRNGRSDHGSAHHQGIYCCSDPKGNKKTTEWAKVRKMMDLWSMQTVHSEEGKQLGCSKPALGCDHRYVGACSPDSRQVVIIAIEELRKSAEYTTDPVLINAHAGTVSCHGCED